MKYLKMFLAASWMVFVVVASASSAPQEEATPAVPDPRPNVLLITVDTLRPDALGWVAGRNETPVIDRLAEEGFRFPAAVSPLPLTQPAHASLMTGLRPRRHGVRTNGRLLGSHLPTLAERMQAAGYATAAFVSGYPLTVASGLDRGFEHYDDQLDEGSAGRLERSAARTVEAAGRWLDSTTQSPTLQSPKTLSPWFLWIHFYDPHDPYEPPADLRQAGSRGAYDGEVRAVDAAIGGLLERLPSQNRLTVLTADHGESLGEHGESTHGFFIYESTQAVPLVIHWPGKVVAAANDEPVRLLDVAPTVLDLLRLPPLDDIDGFSLRPILESKAWLTPDAYMESQRPWLSYGWAPLRALRRGSWKLIAAPQPELYNLLDDPGETVNLVRQKRRLAGELAASLEAIESRSAVAAEVVDDPETLARLRSLGYTGGSSTTSDVPADAADPKDRLDLWHLLGEAEELLDQGKLDDAMQRFDRVLASDVDNPFALGRSGAALATAGRLEAALPRLRKVVGLRPDDSEARASLAATATRVGYLDEAVGHWLELTRRQPRRLDAWAGLASTLGMSGQASKAVEAFEQAVRLAPQRADLVIKLAFAHHAAKQPQQAIERLQQAAQLSGDSFPHAGALGILLLRAGRGDEAAPWLGRSRPQEGDFAEARWQLARWYAAKGETEAARRALAEALQAKPEMRPRATSEPLLEPLLP